MPATKSYTIIFEKEKETPNKWRYKEVVPHGKEEVIGTIYVPKKILETMDDPHLLSVTIKADNRA